MNKKFVLIIVVAVAVTVSVVYISRTIMTSSNNVGETTNAELVPKLYNDNKELHKKIDKSNEEQIRENKKTLKRSEKKNKKLAKKNAKLEKKNNKLKQKKK